MSHPFLTEEEYDRLPVQSQRAYKWDFELERYIHVDYYVPVKIALGGDRK